MRDKNDGHHITTEDILGRNTTSFKHLYECASLMDNLVLIDNSQDDGKIVLEVNERIVTLNQTELPKWLILIWEQF